MEVSYKGVDADCGDGGGERDLGEMAASREGAEADGGEAGREGELDDGSAVDKGARREDDRTRKTEQVRAGRQSIADPAAWSQAALHSCQQRRTQLGSSPCATARHTVEAAAN